MKKIIKYTLSILVISLLTFSLFAKGAKEQDNTKLKVVASFYPVWYLTNEIAKDRINLDLLIKANQEPHGFELAPSNIASLESADILVYNSNYFENYLVDIKESLSNKDLKMVEASRGVNLLKSDSYDEHDHHMEGEDHDHHHDAEDEEHDHDHHGEGEDHDYDHDHHAEGEDHDHDHDHHTEGEDHDYDHDHHAEGEDHDHHHHHGHGGFDPHTWLDPNVAIMMAGEIEEELSESDPANKAFYENNLKDLVNRLMDLSSEYDAKLKNLRSNIIVVSHKAFGYLAHRYNLEQESLRGIDADDEPTGARMAEVVDLVKDHNVKVIFFEELVNPKLSEIIAAEAGVKTMVLSPLEGLSDPNDDYFSVMRRNLDNLVLALK